MRGECQHAAQPTPAPPEALDAFLREGTDGFSTARLTLAIATDAALDAALARLSHLSLLCPGGARRRA